MHDAFVEKLVERVAALRLGSGLEPGTTHGPLITAAAVDGVRGPLGAVKGPLHRREPPQQP